MSAGTIVRPMTAATAYALPGMNEPFQVFGRLAPRYESGAWAYGEELLDKPYDKCYDEEPVRADEYLGHPGRAVYLAFQGDICIGLVRLRRNWNGLALIEDLAVVARARRTGAGTALMDAARAWAGSQGLSGLMLETQDVNLAACRFYRKHGFVIGGVDVCLYAATPAAGERAVFWYSLF